jgi:hypothetical protein
MKDQSRKRRRSVLDRAAHEAVRHNVSWRTSDHRRLSWAEIGDRHLWNIVRLLTRRVRACRIDAAAAIGQRVDILNMHVHARRLALCAAIDELDYRGLLPTPAMLERACAALGANAPRTWLEAWPAWLDLDDAGEYERALIAGWGKG